MDLQFVQPGTQTGAVAALANIRKEWELAAEGESLVKLQASVGLLLLDVAAKLGLTQEEQKSVLGARLYTEAIGKAQEH
jgi:hypothetical protein